MTILGLLAALLLVFLGGMGAALLLGGTGSRVNAFECGALGWLLGTGIVSLSLWSGGLLVSGFALQLVVTIIALAFVLFGFLAARKRKMRVVFPKPRNLIEWILASAIVLEIALLIYLSFKDSLGWDGLLNWEIKARYAFLNGGVGVIPAQYYSDGTRAFTHPGYPLFIPLIELWLYLWMGAPHQFWIKIIFPLYYAAGAILLATIANRLTHRRWPGLVVAALLFFVPGISASSGGAIGGCADAPLGMLYLVTIGYLLIFSKDNDPHALRVYAACLALLPWAKREGAILWVIAAVCGALIIWRQRRPWRSLLWLLPGVALMAAWQIFLLRMNSAEPQEFLPVSITTIQENLPRIPTICRLVAGEMMETTRWSLFWPASLLAFLFLLFRAPNIRLLLLAIAIAAPFSLYAATYIFSGWEDYPAHFAVSFQRLLLHIMPLAWLAIALALPGPAEVQSPPARE